MRLTCGAACFAALWLAGCGDVPIDPFGAEGGAGGIVLLPPTRLVVTPVSGNTGEDGSSASFTVALSRQPTANAAVALLSSDTTEGTIVPSQLNFTVENWAAPQTVVITGSDDAVADGNVAYEIIISSIQSGDASLSEAAVEPIRVTNVDNDRAGIAVGRASRNTDEDGAQASFDVALTSEPLAPVTVAFASEDPSEGVTTASSLTFTRDNWSSEQTVVVTGVDDAISDGNLDYSIAFLPVASTDASYAALVVPPVILTNVDNDAAAMRVSTASGNTAESGARAEFSVSLASRPQSEVVVVCHSADETEGRLDPSRLTFTRDNWVSPQVITVTGVDDELADGNAPYTVVCGNIESGDAAYSALRSVQVALSNIDDDSAGFALSALSGATSEEGGQATFSVALRSRPSQDVVLSLFSSNPNEGVVSPSQLRFTADNWLSPQVVVLTGVDDSVPDGNAVYRVEFIRASSLDASYAALTLPPLTVTNADNDSAGIVVESLSAQTSEEGGVARLSVVLSTQPTDNVSLVASSSDPSEGRVTSPDIVFTPINWASPQWITVTGVDDAAADGNVPYFIDFSPLVTTDVAYAAMRLSHRTLVNIDDETPGFTYSELTGATDESGGQVAFSVRLNSAPTGEVILRPAVSAPTEASVAPTALTFTPLNWQSPQWLTVTGVDDAVVDGAVPYQVTFLPALSADAAYADRVAPDLSLTNVDNDSAGFSVSAVEGQPTEAGGQASFSVWLNSAPSSSVALEVTSSDEGEARVGPESLVFTTEDWAAPKIVTVTGVDDDDADGNAPIRVRFGAPSTADPAYSALRLADRLVFNVDNDTAGFTVGEVDGVVTEGGGEARFSVVLNAPPSAAVTLHFSSSDATEAVVSHSSLTFTPQNWQSPQLIGVVGVDDAAADGNVPFRVQFEATSSLDPAYAAIAPADVILANVDDDSAGLVVAVLDDTTSEAGDTGAFSVRLSSEPSDTVALRFASSLPSEAQLSTSELLFTPHNWASPQTVTVTGVDDAVQDGTAAFAINFQAATSDDGAYDGRITPSLSLLNLDDDSAGFVISRQGSQTTEGGGTAQWSVSLSTQPSAAVELELTCSEPGEAQLSIERLVFTAADWDEPQSVTVTGQNDSVQDGHRPYSVQFSPPITNDSAYAALALSSLNFTNLDDDSAGIIASAVNPPSAHTSESSLGSAVTFSLSLTSEPTLPVLVFLSSSNTGEGTVEPAALAFTPLNWTEPAVVTVTGVDDQVPAQDGNVPYVVTVSIASVDEAYAALTTLPRVELVNDDDDSAGFTVSALSGSATEAGGSATFSVVLNTRPTADVTVTYSSDTAVVALSPNAPPSLTFTPGNWDQVQTITATGLDDSVPQGPEGRAFEVVFGPTASLDPLYAATRPSTVSGVCADDDALGP